MWKTSSKTKEPENLEKAYDYAVFLLSLQLRTAGEVEAKMRQRGYIQSIIDEVISRLKAEKYLDDQRYAEVYLENLKKYKTFGFYGIKKKFMEKRLPPQIVEKVLSDGLSNAEELGIAKRFLKKDPRADQNKKARQLAGKGFRSEVIAKLVFKGSSPEAF